MSGARRLAVGVLATLALLLAVGTSVVSAADECAGLQVCLPFEGPWVVVPAAAPGVAARSDWILACPREGYIVAGTDARLGDRAIDVAIRGETGSPVAPGTTTREAVRFTGLFAGLGRRAVTFRPFIGCIPTSGGGARNQTARSAVGDGFKPTRPIGFVVVGKRLTSRSTTVVVRCPAGARLVDATHALSFHTALPPATAVLGQVRTLARRSGNTFTVVATAQPAALSATPEVQVQATCTRAGR